MGAVVLFSEQGGGQGGDLHQECSDMLHVTDPTSQHCAWYTAGT